MIGKTNAVKKGGVKIPSVTNVAVSQYGDLTFNEPDYSELEQYDPFITYVVNVNGEEFETTYNDVNLLHSLVEGENTVSVTVKAVLRHFGSETGETIMFSIPEYTNPALFTLETTTVGDVSGYKVTAYNGTESEVNIPEYNSDGLPILELNSINVSKINGAHIKKLNSFENNKTVTEVNFPETTNESFAKMFYYCDNLSKVKNINTRNATDLSGMFSNCSDNFYTAPWLDTSNVTNMSSIFSSCNHLTKIPLYDTSNVTKMDYMFMYCRSLTTIPQLNTSNVTSMENMFASCSNLTAIPQLNTSNVTNMRGMFSSCTNLTAIPQLDTSNVKQMQSMFSGCANLTTIPQLDTSKCINFMSMFNKCANLITAPILDFINTKSNYQGIATNTVFSGCTNLTNLTIKNIWLNLYIGSGTSWGHLLTLDSLINTCKECIKQTSSRTLTVGTANLEKLANVYVKFTDPSQTEIDVLDKGDIVVCESTDEGAMLISDYMTLKSWTLA